MRRYLFGVLGLAVMAIGIAFSIVADLGTSPISSLPYVASLISPLTVGTATIAMNAGFILLQILIRRRKYDPRQLAQIPAAIAIGFMCDGALWLMSGLDYSNYATQWLYCILGILGVGIGVAMTVTSKVIVMGGEGLIVAISTTLIEKYGPRRPFVFGDVKIAFDVTLVLSAVILSLTFLGRVEGVREGTVAAAIFVGVVARFFVRKLAGFERTYLDRTDEPE